MSKRNDGQARGKYTLEFKLEAVRLVKGGQSVPVTGKILGVPSQTLGNWVRLSEKDQLKGAGDKPVSQEQMELARPRASCVRHTEVISRGWQSRSIEHRPRGINSAANSQVTGVFCGNGWFVPLSNFRSSQKLSVVESAQRFGQAHLRNLGRHCYRRWRRNNLR
jgi:transposase